MKKLIKIGVYGIHEQCIYALFTKDQSTVAAEEKKKKKNTDAVRLSAIQTYTVFLTKIVINFFFFWEMISSIKQKRQIHIFKLANMNNCNS